MILRYHVTAKYSQRSGMQTHEKGFGSLFNLQYTELMRNRAIEIAREIPYTTISVCAPRGKDGIAKVYVRSLFGSNIIHQAYSKKLEEKL